MIGVFIGFSCIFLVGILICKGLTARRLYKSFGVKGLMCTVLLQPGVTPIEVNQYTVSYISLQTQI
jgi:C4-dicarboxylate transporter